MFRFFNRLKTLFVLLKATFNLKRKVNELVSNLNDLSPAPAPRNRAERRMLARKGHL